MSNDTTVGEILKSLKGAIKELELLDPNMRVALTNYYIDISVPSEEEVREMGLTATADVTIIIE